MRPHLRPWARSRTSSSTGAANENGPPSNLGGGKLPSPQAHVAATADAFDATQEYCTPTVVFIWQPPSCFSQWTPSRLTIYGTSYLCAEQYFAAEKVASLVTTTRFRYHACVRLQASPAIRTRGTQFRCRCVETRARKHSARRFLRQVHPNSSHATASAGYRRSAACRSP